MMYIQKMLKASLAAMPLVGFTSTIPVEGAATAASLKTQLEGLYGFTGTKNQYTVTATSGGDQKIVVHTVSVEDKNANQEYTIQLYMGKPTGDKLTEATWATYTEDSKDAALIAVKADGLLKNEITMYIWYTARGHCEGDVFSGNEQDCKDAGKTWNPDGKCFMSSYNSKADCEGAGVTWEPAGVYARVYLNQSEADRVKNGQESQEPFQWMVGGAARSYTLVGASMAMFAAFLAA